MNDFTKRVKKALENPEMFPTLSRIGESLGFWDTGLGESMTPAELFSTLLGYLANPRYLDDLNNLSALISSRIPSVITNEGLLNELMKRSITCCQRRKTEIQMLNVRRLL
jgi:hypothetical protein